MFREMKDSGIEWIGKIPKEWEVIRTKNIYSNPKSIVGDKADNYDRLALTLNGVIKRSKEDSNGLQPEKFEGYQILKENELVFKLIDLENVATSRVGLSPYTGLVSPAYIILDNEEHSKFGYYYFISMYYQKIFNKLGGDGVRSNLNAKDLLNIPYLNIIEEERIKISNYLDKKVFQINGIISKQKILIEKYKAYKQSIITETVTKGLNKNVPMKESGIEWAQDIPQKWEVKKYKHVMYKKKDICFKYDGESVLSLTMKGVIVRDLENPMGKMPASFDGYQRLYVGNLLLCLFDIDVTPRCIGLIENDGLTSPAYSQFVMKDNNNAKYYMYLLTMIDDKKYFVHLSKNLRSSLTEDDFGVIKTIVPPIDEQKQIADFLDKKCNAIDSVISKKEQLIEELERYKKSLIYECVTGKREVN